MERWLNLVWDAPVSSGCALVLFGVAQYWGRAFEPVYSSERELIDLILDRRKDLKAAQIKKALDEGVRVGLLTKVFRSRDRFTATVYAPRIPQERAYDNTQEVYRCEGPADAMVDEVTAAMEAANGEKTSLANPEDPRPAA